jgi:beta-phosphoglucomutase-like phosphatase (HAD superfamily)
MRGDKAYYGLSDDLQALVDERNALYRKIALGSSNSYPPIGALLKKLADRKMPMAVATGFNSAITGEILEFPLRFTGANPRRTSFLKRRG